jgi:hypothetical protein
MGACNVRIFELLEKAVIQGRFMTRNATCPEVFQLLGIRNGCPDRAFRRMGENKFFSPLISPMTSRCAVGCEQSMFYEC